MELLQKVKNRLSEIKKTADARSLSMSDILYHNSDCQILSQSSVRFDFLVSGSNNGDASEISLFIEDEGIFPGNEKATWNHENIACLKLMNSELQSLEPGHHLEHKKYSREGMIKRVLKERQDKALKASYRIDWASNIYGDHVLTNENGVKYKLFLRDFENQTGYSNSPDARGNKLGTTKHLMYAFNQLKENSWRFDSLSKTCPFVEVFLDPLNDYKITWFYPHPMPLDIQMVISKYFGKNQFIEDEEVPRFLNFLDEAGEIERIVIRPEVPEKIEKHFEDEVLANLRDTEKADFSIVKASLYEYQTRGIQFATFRKAAIIADEMGLGKTLQAIGAAINKKNFFGFKKTLVVCPASLKAQWKKEVESFTDEKACIIEGFPEERVRLYRDSEAFFLIVNYETVLRDRAFINKADIDFLILDEAQRVKNFATKTATAISSLHKKHTLVITGTPIENRLIDIFSIVNVLESGFLGPLWEFSYQYCLFDPDKHDKINGYYNLQELKERLQPILIRREKRKVLDQLPNVRQINIPVGLSGLQADYHASYARGVSQIVRKKFMTPFDMKRLQLLLANMRMVCDSSYLVDKETYESPKLDELKYLLLEQLDVRNSPRKIIIFSEWVTMLKLIGRMLRENGVAFVELNGSVPVKNRGALISRFENDSNVKVFLSSEAGGSGLNLQVASTLVNFELPWNPAKKNQRIGRIDRLGQENKHLTIINFITRNSIEERIAAGLEVKQNLFEGVLDEGNNINTVDFSAKGRSQFLEQIESFIGEFEDPDPTEETETGKISEETEAIDHETDTPGDINLSEEGNENEQDEPIEEHHANQDKTPVSKGEDLEQVMNSGMQFLSGLYKMSTGKDMGMEDQKIEVNRETGEVTMKFKLPGF